MQILPIDVTALVATVLGISIVLIPVLGVTARFALHPTVEALSKLFDKRSSDETLRIVERRLELQEQEIAMLTQAVRSLGEAHEFDRALKAPDADEASESAAGAGEAAARASESAARAGEAPTTAGESAAGAGEAPGRP